MKYRSISLFAVAASLTVLVFSCAPLLFFANGTHVNIPDASLDYTQSTIDVGPSFNIADVKVGVDIVHPEDSDLDGFVESPHGTVVHLIANESGANFTGTVFDDMASKSIDQGKAPYEGHWKIDSFYVGEALSDFNGEDAQGTWTLNIRDKVPGNTGYIAGWSLRFTAQ